MWSYVRVLECPQDADGGEALQEAYSDPCGGDHDWNSQPLSHWSTFKGSR